MIWLIVPLTILLWCLGGQLNKLYRRVALPIGLTVVGVAKGFMESKDKKERWIGFLLLLYIPILSIGYGVDSALGKLLGGTEWLIRLIYGLLCCLPILVIVICTQQWIKLASIPGILGAFQIKAGSVKVGKYDLLFEDVLRAGVIGAAIAWSFA